MRAWSARSSMSTSNFILFAEQAKLMSVLRRPDSSAYAVAYGASVGVENKCSSSICSMLMGAM